MLCPHSYFTCLIQGFIRYHHQANAYVNIPSVHGADDTSQKFRNWCFTLTSIT